MMAGRAVGTVVGSITDLAMDSLCGYTAEGLLAATFALLALDKVTETAA
jgi:hypothetical protein